MKAGFGKVDITPRVGVELCGFGPYLNRHSTRVLEPLFARAMAVEAGGNRWVLVSCDLIGFNDILTQRIRHLVPDVPVMVHATHTHSGPCTIPELIGWGDPDEPYLEVLPQYVAQACHAALRDLAPATIHHAEVPAAGFSYNRELPAETRTNELAIEGKWTTDKPAETDTAAHVFRVERAGKVAGFLTYFSCHPVVCCERNTEIHGDFVGVATNRVEREHPGAIGIFLQGAQGDINSNYVHGPAAESLVALERFGERFAGVIRAGLAQAQPFMVESVGAALIDAPYTLAPFDELALRTALAEHEASIAKGGITQAERSGRIAMVYAKGIRRILTSQGAKRPMSAQALRFGEFTLTALPLELMHRIKRRMQKELGSRALLLSVTNGFLGYAPLREYYRPPTVRYSVVNVPLMLGWLPFTENIEDEALAAALKVTRMV